MTDDRTETTVEQQLPAEVPANQPEAFAAQQVAAIGQSETAASAAAAQAQAAVQARYVMAMQRPRNIDEVRQRLMRECRRPSFAAVAKYHKPIGQGVVGPSIRFAEAAMRCMTNVFPETMTVYDDPYKRIVRVSVTDLEANVTYSKDVTVDKTVERSNAKGRHVLSERVNSYGKKAYLVAATEDELLNKEGALVSKAMRTCALRLLPGDLVDEAMGVIERTRRDEMAQDPDAVRRQLADGFARLGVSALALTQYLGKTLDKIDPDDLDELRSLYEAIRDGETTWQAVTENKEEQEEANAKAPPEPKSGKGRELADGILNAIADATTPMELAAEAKQIAKLPKKLQDEVKAAYEARRIELEEDA